MQCRQVRENLAGYMAGEHWYFDVEALEGHLEECDGCREELAGIVQVDLLLDQLDDYQAPDDFHHHVMATLVKPRVMTGQGKSGRLNLLKDLVAAAAVTLLIFWGGMMHNPEQVNSANRNVSQGVNQFVTGYVNYSSQAVEKVLSTTGSVTQEMLTREWKLK